MKTSKWVLLLFVLCIAAVQANEKPSFDMDWYGHFKLDGSYDQNLTSHGNFAMWVKPQVYEADDAQYNMTANATRFGVNIKGKNYKKAMVNGKLEFDLFAGVGGGTVAENKAMLQMRHAYFTVQVGNTKLLAGQSWDLISPLNPSTLNYPVLWGAGNTGYRRAQVSVWQKFDAGSSTSIMTAAGVFRTIGNDLTPTFSLAAGETSESSDDGTDAAIPSFQGRLDVTHKFASGSFVRWGASGLWGQLKAETNLGNYQDYESWAGVGHLMVSFAQGFGFSGEAYTGSNMGSYFGGVLNASTIEGVESKGGWVSTWVKPSSKVKFSAGYGLDDPDDLFLSSGQRSQNQCMFGNVTYSLVEQVTVGFELSNWETSYKDGDTAENLRAQTSFVLKF